MLTPSFRNLFYNIGGVRKGFLISQNLLFNFLHKKDFGNQVKIYGFPIVSLIKHSKITVGTNLVLISESYFSGPGVNHPVIIRTLTSTARITIGNNVGMSGGSICAAENITIGNDVLIGANSIITDNDFHVIQPETRRCSQDKLFGKKVVIEDNVFIGMNCLILKGVTIGRDSVIGAGSIVTKDVPPQCISAGAPAKLVRMI